MFLIIKNEYVFPIQSVSCGFFSIIQSLSLYLFQTSCAFDCFSNSTWIFVSKQAGEQIYFAQGMYIMEPVNWFFRLNFHMPFLQGEYTLEMLCLEPPS